MFTKEQLISNSVMAKMALKIGRSVKCVLNSEEQEEALRNGRGFQVISNGEVWWFTDDYCMGVDLLPSQFVPCSMGCPMNVVPRDVLPNGIVDSVESYIKIFEYDSRQISSIEELVEYLNKKFCSG